MITSIIYVAGHSGGHILPAIAHAQQMIEQHPEYKVGMISTDASLDCMIIGKHAIAQNHKTLHCSMPKVSNVVLRYLILLWRLFVSWCQSIYMLYQAQPKKVISMGGMISLPVCLAAWIMRIPVELYELNVQPGRAIKFLAPFADKINICFSSTASHFAQEKTQVVSYPSRFKPQDIIPQEQARAILGLQDRRTLFVLGGSQGSHDINMMMQTFVETLQSKECHALQIIHQTGAHDVAYMQQVYDAKGIPALVFAYRHDIQVCYCAADIVISRAGAGALQEILFFRKPSIIIPLEMVAAAHQVDNAQAYMTEAKLHNVPSVMLRQKDIVCRKQTFGETLEHMMVT